MSYEITMLSIDPLGNPQPTYVQVADVIAARIDSGVYTDRLPSERALAKEFGVAYMTLRHATHLLRERGLIVARQGRGTFVAGVLSCLTSPKEIRTATGPS